MTSDQVNRKSAQINHIAISMHLNLFNFFARAHSTLDMALIEDYFGPVRSVPFRVLAIPHNFLAK